ncbi:MAG: urease accessory UreF family protein, partial [Alphaproteobacteria bacterium]
MATITAMTARGLREQGLYRLLTWLSPGFPVGAFSYSHGVEYAIEAGLVADGDSLRGWIEGIVRHGSGRVDADLFRDTWRAVTDGGDLASTVELAGVLRGTAEMALESAAQGAAFLDTVLGTAQDPAVLS